MSNKFKNKLLELKANWQIRFLKQSNVNALRTRLSDSKLNKVQLINSKFNIKDRNNWGSAPPHCESIYLKENIEFKNEKIIVKAKKNIFYYRKNG